MKYVYYAINMFFSRKVPAILIRYPSGLDVKLHLINIEIHLNQFKFILVELENPFVPEPA